MGSTFSARLIFMRWATARTHFWWSLRKLQSEPDCAFHTLCIISTRHIRHEIYRPTLLDHLLTVTIRHWDPVMRRLGAQSVRAICELDIWKLAEDCVQKAVGTIQIIPLSYDESHLTVSRLLTSHSLTQAMFTGHS